jgi:hypothetical protein
MRVDPQTLLFTLGLSLAAGMAFAQDRPEPPADRDHAPRERRKPPEAAFSACEDMSEDDVCQVELKDRTIDGKCVADKDDGKLFCMPEHPPLPPEAADACKSKSAGDACSMTGPDGKAMPEGVCVEGREGLHCRPPKPPAQN